MTRTVVGRNAPLAPLPDPTTCRAVVAEPPHWLHTHRCTNRARSLRGGYPVCGTHERAFFIEVTPPATASEPVT